MDNTILVSFITGLTAGGLSCFAVQGGLLSGTLAQRAAINQGVKADHRVNKKVRARSTPPQAGMLQSVLLFLSAKLVVHTLLGFALGLLGSVLYLSPTVKGAVQVAIGIFLVGNALRMFNVHPIFRYFTFEPPQKLTRFIRRTAKGQDHIVTPLFLGMLTIFIPCGVTQAVMAVAVGTGNPWLGAAILFAFTLGASPTFLGVTVLATGLAKAFQKYFYPVAAAIVLLLGVYTVNGGLNLMGSPFSSNAISRALSGKLAENTSPIPPVERAFSSAPSEVVSEQDATDPTPTEDSVSNIVVIKAENSGYSPSVVAAPADQPIELHLVTENTQSCTRAFVIPAMNTMEILPASGDMVFNLPPQPAGSTMEFTCSMGMYGGVIEFE